PEPTLSKDPLYWANWMQAYFDTYINRDLRRNFPRLDTVRFRRFIQMLSNVSGQIAVKRDLSQSIEVSESTIKDYIEIAHGTFVWRNLPSFEHNIKKEVFKMPRGHLRDSGLLHYLLKFRELEDLESHPVLGRSFESFAIEEIIRGMQATDSVGWTAHYYRTRARSEIDLILHGSFGVVPIEIKHGSQVRQKDFSTLKKFVEEHHLPYGFLVNNGQEVQQLAERVVQIPIGCL
ncbi:DUF4143 domain-containing protein, partial [bacterium]|nr:DUF4143 domain-containing protein [bacterium]